MTSKSSFFNFNLMKEDISHRLYVLAFSCLVFFFIYPVGTLLLISAAKHNFYFDSMSQLTYEQQLAQDILHDFREMYTSGFDTFFLICIGVAIALTGFSYLMRANRADFYHALPYRRECLFFTTLIDGILLAVVPCVFFAFLAGCIAMARTGRMYPMYIIAGTIFEGIMRFLICYCTTVLSVMLCGQIFISMMGTAVMFFYVPALTWLIYLLHTEFFNTYYGDCFDEVYGGFAQLSPLLYRAGDNKLLTGIILLAVSAAVTAISLYLYKIRPIEGAGKALVFDRTKFPIKLLLVVPCALGGAVVMKAVTHSRMWAAFGMVCAFLLSICMLEIIYNADFKKLFSNMGQLGVCLGVSLILFLVFCFDLLGYDRYVPDEASLDSAGLACNVIEQNQWQLNGKLELEWDEIYATYNLADESYSELSQIDNMRITDKAVLTELAKAGVNSDKYDEDDISFAADSYEDTEDDDITVSYSISYHLKSGRNIRRRYLADWEDIRVFIEKIHDNPEYKLGTYPVLSMGEEELSGINCQTIFGKDHVRADEERLYEILGAYKREMSALSFETRRHEDPVACLQFKSHDFQKMADTIKEQNPRSWYEFNDTGYYPVYPSFKETLSLLEQCGVRTRNLLNADNVKSVELYYDPDYAYDQDGVTKELVTTNKAEIAQILEASSYGLDYTNGINPHFYLMDCNVEPDKSLIAEQIIMSEDMDMNSVNRSYYVYLYAEKIPDFVKSYYSLTDEDIFENSQTRF